MRLEPCCNITAAGLPVVKCPVCNRWSSVCWDDFPEPCTAEWLRCPSCKTELHVRLGFSVTSARI